MGSRSGAGSAAPGTILISIHDFVARSVDELSLAKGDRIELLERDDDFGDGWFLGKHMTNGHSGLFPEVYTTPAPKGTLVGPGSNNKTRHTSNDAAPMLATQTAAANLAASPAASNTSPTLPRSASANAHQSLPATSIGAQAPVASAATLRSSLPTTAATGPRSFTITSDSPVMSETLSVINEHITDMKSPRALYTNGNKRDTLSSVYSNHPHTRRSYIAGHETDEEEHQLHTEEEVMAWGPARVAEYLEDHGVEKAHCEVFKEQEISGEVLLAMDQNSLFIKEFELGAIGRRLKTWHKIKTLQDEVRRSNPEVDRSVSAYSLDQEAEDSPTVDTARNRSSTIGTPSLPRALTTKRRSGDSIPTRTNTMQDIQGAYPAASGASKRGSTSLSPLQAITSTRAENTYRPSAQGIRNLNHSRRHSSIDSTSTDGASRVNHRKKASIDQRWEPGQQLNGGHAHTASTDSSFVQRKPSAVTGASPDDLDRGYFSSNEVESRTRRSVLTKRISTTVSPMESRANSFLYATTENPISPIALSSHQTHAMAAVNNMFGNYRSATTPAASSKPGSKLHSPMTPVVTKLDPSSNQSLNAIAASPTRIQDNASDASSDKAAPSPSRLNLGMFSQAKAKVTGLRSTSDAVTKNEKTMQPIQFDQPVKSPTRTGSSTPSTGEKSLDLSKSDLTSRASTGSGGALMPPLPAKRPRAKTKTKKMTSAYTRGLEKKPPQEALLNCDYSGWMKKKSGSLMTTWKPRLFILRGRRLSYYYADDDTEEKGLIDISYHRVLPAHNETLTGLHATVTGAGSAASPTHGSTPTMAEKDLHNRPALKGDDDGLFIFKLVPPKAGLAKGVSFTKPTVHYFAVSSRAEGRLWMAALMKATIDRDDDGVVTTTYNQKTISLAKAQARRERPPALKEEGVEGPVELYAGDEASERGLGIGGMSDKEPSTLGGAENGADDQDSIAPSNYTNATGTESDLNENEREAVALNAPS